MADFALPLRARKSITTRMYSPSLIPGPRSDVSPALRIAGTRVSRKFIITLNGDIHNPNLEMIPQDNFMTSTSLFSCCSKASTSVKQAFRIRGKRKTSVFSDRGVNIGDGSRNGFSTLDRRKAWPAFWGLLSYKLDGSGEWCTVSHQQSSDANIARYTNPRRRARACKRQNHFVKQNTRSGDISDVNEQRQAVRRNGLDFSRFDELEDRFGRRVKGVIRAGHLLKSGPKMQDANVSHWAKRHREPDYLSYFTFTIDGRDL